ncbi:hypothetical protein MSAN_00259700 [Mycena sanguinolenta]|uniref:Uncharacterized protein n=1 Tax=Mycena sanguinolenta TaxID=230812 RepID=A0A8H6ZJ52_9AGAR|nr:hypothetical protein MSAN_00259700 [Mycena sanguinolenta]
MPRFGHGPVPPSLSGCNVVDLTRRRRVREPKLRQERERRAHRVHAKRAHQKLRRKMREWEERWAQHWAQERECEERQRQQREQEEQERLKREQAEQWGRDQRKREREEQEREEYGRLQRRVQLTQMLEAPPEGRLLTLLSLFSAHFTLLFQPSSNLFTLAVFIMLAVLALGLIGWFIFLGLLITILAYLLLIISFMSHSTFALLSPRLKFTGTFIQFHRHSLPAIA